MGLAILIVVLTVLVGASFWFMSGFKQGPTPIARRAPRSLGDPNWTEPQLEYEKVRYWSDRHGWRNCYLVTTDGSGRHHLQLRNRSEVTVRRMFIVDGWVEKPEDMAQYLVNLEKRLGPTDSEPLDLSPVTPIDEAAGYGAVNPT